MKDCFICMNNDDNLPVFKVCECDTYVHEECYKKLVNVPSHVTHCAVCRQPYAMTVEYRWGLHWNKRSTLGLLLIALSTTTLIVGCVEVTLPLAWPDIALKTVIVTSMLSVNALLAFAIIVRHRRHGRICCIWPERQVSSKILHLSEPLQADRPMPTPVSGADRPVATLPLVAINDTEIVLTNFFTASNNVVMRNGHAATNRLRNSSEDRSPSSTPTHPRS